MKKNKWKAIWASAARFLVTPKQLLKTAAGATVVVPMAAVSLIPSAHAQDARSLNLSQSAQNPSTVLSFAQLHALAASPTAVFSPPANIYAAPTVPAAAPALNPVPVARDKTVRYANLSGAMFGDNSPDVSYEFAVTVRASDGQSSAVVYKSRLGEASQTFNAASYASLMSRLTQLAKNEPASTTRGLSAADMRFAGITAATLLVPLPKPAASVGATSTPQETIAPLATPSANAAPHTVNYQFQVDNVWYSYVTTFASTGVASLSYRFNGTSWELVSLNQPLTAALAQKARAEAGPANKQLSAAEIAAMAPMKAAANNLTAPGPQSASLPSASDATISTAPDINLSLDGDSGFDNDNGMDACVAALMKAGAPHGLKSHMAIGLAANFMDESRCNPHQAQLSGGPGYALAQWDEGRQSIYASLRGYSMQDARSTLEDQAAFAIYELFEGNYAGVGEKLLETATADQAAVLLTEHYEVPSKKYWDKAIRQRLALVHGYMPGTAIAGMIAPAQSHQRLSQAAPAAPATILPAAKISATASINTAAMRAIAPAPVDTGNDHQAARNTPAKFQQAVGTSDPLVTVADTSLFKDYIVKPVYQTPDDQVAKPQTLAQQNQRADAEIFNQCFGTGSLAQLIDHGRVYKKGGRTRVEAVRVDGGVQMTETYQGKLMCQATFTSSDDAGALKVFMKIYDEKDPAKITIATARYDDKGLSIVRGGGNAAKPYLRSMADMLKSDVRKGYGGSVMFPIRKDVLPAATHQELSI